MCINCAMWNEDRRQGRERRSRKLHWLVGSDFEYRVIVQKMQNEYWYTLERRRWISALSIPLWWSKVTPIWQPTYEKAWNLRAPRLRSDSGGRKEQMKRYDGEPTEGHSQYFANASDATDRLDALVRRPNTMNLKNKTKRWQEFSDTECPPHLVNLTESKYDY